MAKKDDGFKRITSHCKEYGYIFQSSELYDGLSAVYDYGPFGTELKENIKSYWRKAMVRLNENVVGLDSAIFMHPKVWKASGHVDGFSDPLIDNKDSKKRYRADVLLEDQIEKYRKKRKHDKAEALEQAFSAAAEANNLQAIKALIEEHEIACPVSGTRNWTDVKQFNLMFATQMGSVAEEANEVYLRPETAQGIFVNYANVQKTARQKIPFGIAQIGKAFRNEIVARQFLFRMKEFEQMEMQFFVRPGTELEWFEHWKEKRLQWHLALGINPDKYRYHEHAKLAHYANAAVDIEYEFPFGFKEVEGIHSRTDFDLKRHEEFSGRKQQYYDPEIQENYTPYVVETSIGLDRMFFLLLSEALQDEEVTAGDKTTTRTVLKLPPTLAPTKVAIFPLTKKDGLPEKSLEIFRTFRYHFDCVYEEKDSIGKRYRRQDAIGTPYCITVDHQTLEDDTVTLRYRDTMEQRRIHVNELLAEVRVELDDSKLLQNL